MLVRVLLSGALLAVLASACAGGGNTAPSAIATSKPQSVAVQFKISIPTATAAQARKPAYISAATQSATVNVSPGNTTTIVSCNATAKTCSGTVLAPVGSDTFKVSLYDAANGSGNLLSIGSLTQTIVIDQANAVNVTFNGVVASFSVALNPTSVTAGTSTTVAVTVNALDADGNTIIAPGVYVNASGSALTVNLADSDGSGATKLSPSSLTQPTSGITLSYNGASITSPTITASATGATSGNATLTVNASSTAFCPTPPTGLFPMFIQNSTNVSGSITVYISGLNPSALTTWVYLTSATAGTTQTLPASGTPIPGFALPANGCINLPPLVSGRVYLALGGATLAGYVSNGSSSGVNYPAPWTTAANANTNVAFDFLEYTWTTTGSSFNIDVTQVDALGIPISFQAVNSSGTPAASPLYGMKSKAVTNLESDLNALGSPWTGLIQQTGTSGVSRVISPQHAVNIPADNFTPAPGATYPPNSPTMSPTYYDPIISQIWATYQGSNFLPMSYAQFPSPAYGIVDPSTNVFNFYSSASTSSTLLGSVPYPTTWDVFNNAGAFTAPSATGTYGIYLGRALVVNIERGTLPVPGTLPSTWPAGPQPFCGSSDWVNFYGGAATTGGTIPNSSVVTNWYSALLHKYGQAPTSGLPGLAYGFPDDDECQGPVTGLYDPDYSQVYTPGEQWSVTLNPL